MDFWKAYLILRRKYCSRPEQVAVGVGVSMHSVLSWDRCAKDPAHDSTGKNGGHGRAPKANHRDALARFAEQLGAPHRMVRALEPDPVSEART